MVRARHRPDGLAPRLLTHKATRHPTPHLSRRAQIRVRTAGLREERVPFFAGTFERCVEEIDGALPAEWIRKEGWARASIGSWEHRSLVVRTNRPAVVLR